MHRLLQLLLLVVIALALSLTFSHASVLEATTFLSPGGPGPMKQWSGVHLGIRPDADWNSALFAEISGDRGGVWPDTVVLMSDQFYNVERDSNNRITRVDTGRPDTLSYLQRASEQGVGIIIRIQPSPGNFRQDSLNNHVLLVTPIDYDHGRLLNDLTGKPEYGWHEAYRDSSADNQIERPWFSRWWSGPEVWVEPLYLPTLINTGP